MHGARLRTNSRSASLIIETSANLRASPPPSKLRQSVAFDLLSGSTLHRLLHGWIVLQAAGLTHLENEDSAKQEEDCCQPKDGTVAKRYNPKTSGHKDHDATQ